jgi:hypothetical protein
LSAHPPPAVLAPRSAADMLRDLANAMDGDTVTLDEILSALGNRGFGLLILVLALPNAIPGPMIPGFSVPFALGIIVMATQILQGQRRPLLPGWLRRRPIKRERFRNLIERADPLLRRLERWFKPRPAGFLSRSTERPIALGIILIVYALVLALPIPLSNGPQAFAICIIGLGLFEGDERVQTAGIMFGLATTVLNAAIVTAGVQIFTHALKIFGS